MNNPYQKALLPALISSIALLSACGGGNGTNPTAQKLTSGVITGFGSVFVNGCEYDTSNASISSDDVSVPGGNTPAQTNLDVGMNVTVTGSATTTNANGQCTGTADKIIYDNDVEGPVAAGSLTRTSLNGVVTEVTVTIFGQTVLMNQDTVFKSQSGAAYKLTSVAEGDVLEVSGMKDASGTLVATYVELQDQKSYGPGADQYEVKGNVQNLDATAMTFDIDGTVINYSNASYDGMNASDLANGLFVEVKGLPDSSGNLAASTIQAEDDGVTPGSTYDSELEGKITQLDSAAQTFSLQGVTVDYSNATLEPSSLSLKNDLHVEVKGDLVVADDGSRSLSASLIQGKGNKIKVQAEITAIDPNADPNADLLTVQVFGHDLTVRASSTWTQIEHDVPSVDPASDYSVGDFVEIEAMDDGSGVINAVSLKTRATGDVQLAGPVESYDATGMTVTLFGVSFSYTGSTAMQMNHTPPADAAAFWSSVDAQGFVTLIDQAPADGSIDVIQVESGNGG